MRIRISLILILTALVASCAGCAIKTTYERTLSDCSNGQSHNALGGYCQACGELPGQLGDDC